MGRGAHAAISGQRINYITPLKCLYHKSFDKVLEQKISLLTPSNVINDCLLFFPVAF